MVSENLYIIKKIFIDAKSAGEPSFNVTLPATFTHLKAAKEAAKTLLTDEGYDIAFFPIYEVKNGDPEWKHGDGVVVYARGPSGELFQIEIETVPNQLGLDAEATGRVKKPLFHVVQTIIEYNEDRSGTQRCIIVEGTHTSWEHARDQALETLLSEGIGKEDYVEYDEAAEGTESLFGIDVIVHAVKEGGQNVIVSVISDNHGRD